MSHALISHLQVRSRVRRTRAEIAQLLAEYHASGLSQLAFGRSHGIQQPTLSYWLRTARLRKDKDTEDLPRLVPVKIKSGPTEQSAPARSGFELDLPRGLRLWIPPDFDERTLERLLPILAGRC
jgi:hypothetical protein